MTKFQKIFYGIKTFKNYDTAGEDVNYKVIIDDENREVILQFEESRLSDSIWHSDWFHNFMFIPWLLKLNNKWVWTTHGYACAYKSAKDIPITEFCIKVSNCKGYRPVIRGWSFGSAMAKIALRHFYIINGYKVKSIITYGDVKCWLNPFIKSRKWADSVYEFTCINDFVTWCVPFFNRTHNCSVGGKLSLKRLFNTPYEHTHYEEYDYSKYEKN